MSRSIRFLGLAIFAWAGVRAVSLGIVPGFEAFALDSSASQRSALIPPIEPTMLPPIDPASTGTGMSMATVSYYPTHPAYQGYAPYPVYVPVNASAARSTPPQVIYVNPPYGAPPEAMAGYDPVAEPAMPPDFATFRPVPSIQTTPSFEKPNWLPDLKKLSVTGWAMMRSEGGPDSLAGRGMLGGSEAGARLMWQLTPKLSATLRSSAPVNSERGAEGALGVRYQPLRTLPVALTLERRHGFRDYGRNAFALFAEGGVYGRPMPWRSTLDGYFQAGVVDFNNPDWFVDGHLAVSRPLWRNLSGGLGAWGGAQPGLNRVDIGPRMSLGVGRHMRAHVDYRLNVAGNARPGSGAVVTLASDF